MIRRYSKMRGKYIYFVAGILIGGALFGGGTAYAAGILADPFTGPIYVDGQQVQMTAYNIGGNNYVKLRDIGRVVGFNVYWDNGVQIDSRASYTGETPVPATELDEVRQEIVRLVNEVRRQNGVPELPVNAALMTAAQTCSEQGLRKHDMQYEGETVLASGYPYGFSSNLTCFSGGSKLQNIAETAVTNWVNSSGHFQTMIDPSADCLGVGVAVKNNMAYCYMMVGDASSHNPYE